MPHREIRRKDRAIAREDTLAILEKGEWGVLASADADGLPLATPLSYVVMEGALYFHCALAGHKMDNISARPQVCFCVVGPTKPVYTGDFSTYYESAVVHGAATLVQDEDEKRQVLLALCEKYLPEFMDKAPGDIDRSFVRTAVVRIGLDQISGKAKRA